MVRITRHVTLGVAALATLMWCARTTVTNRVDSGHRGDAGFSTLEWVVIAVGVFTAAGLAVAAIAAAISGRLGQIT